MFLVQYSLGVKRDEMRKLEEIAQAEEKKLEKAEQYLEEDAAMFDEFLKDNDKNAVEAIKVYLSHSLNQGCHPLHDIPLSTQSEEKST